MLMWYLLSVINYEIQDTVCTSEWELHVWTYTHTHIYFSSHYLPASSYSHNSYQFLLSMVSSFSVPPPLPLLPLSFFCSCFPSLRSVILHHFLPMGSFKFYFTWVDPHNHSMFKNPIIFLLGIVWKIVKIFCVF